MREIRFRGKNAKGEWVIGDLLRNRGETFIAPDGIQNPLATADDFLVDQETVGQFTGLTDRNGTEIYAGDIIALGDRKKTRGTIEWHDREPAFTLCTTQGSCYTLYRDNAKKYLVVGNRTDTPELLNPKQS